MLIASHRLSVLEKCDRVILLSEGKVIGVDSLAKLQQKFPDFWVQENDVELSND